MKNIHTFKQKEKSLEKSKQKYFFAEIVKSGKV